MNIVVDRFCGFVDLSSIDLDLRGFPAKTSEVVGFFEAFLSQFIYTVQLQYWPVCLPRLMA